MSTPHTQPHNTGVLHDERVHSRDWRLGGPSGITWEERNPAADWSDYIPELELQRRDGLETMACVSYSALNCIETLHRFKYGEEVNYSDRFTAAVSNTTKQGNYLRNVAEAIRKYGLVPEKTWPWRDSISTWEEYYIAIPAEIKQTGAEWLEKYNVRWQWVDPENMQAQPEKLKRALKFAPVQIVRRDISHAIMLYGYEDGVKWSYFDHYDQEFREVPWDHPIYAPLQFEITLNDQSMEVPNIENDTLVQLVEGDGGFGLALDGKLIVDDLEKILASWAVRNNGETAGKVASLEQSEWDKFEKVNLKGEPV